MFLVVVLSVVKTREEASIFNYLITEVKWVRYDDGVALLHGVQLFQIVSLHIRTSIIFENYVLS